jgi:translation initiation factor eIF-2B subunit delta
MSATHLPDRFLGLMEQIRSDDRNGATFLSRRAAEALLTLSPDDIGPERGSHRAAAAVREAARRVAAAQPSMAPLRNLAARAGAAHTVAELHAVCRAFLQEISDANRAMATEALPSIPDGATVVTISDSEAVRAAILAAHRAGRRIRVVAVESGPAFEGRELARRLAESGLAVVLVADGQGPAEAAKGDLVLTGADAVTPAGILNKRGTRPMAESA